MSATSKKVIMQALVDGVLTELMAKTHSDNVFVDDTTTLSTKIAEMVADIGTRAKSSDVTSQISAAIDGLINGAPETYNTLKEIADYIAENEDAVTALNSAIGNKADKTAFESLNATVNALGALAKKNTISESDLDSTLKNKINTAASGNHSHSNKSVLDGITAAQVSEWDAAADGNHAHNNKTVLDGVTAEKVSAWDTAADNDHTHSNKAALDTVTSDKISNWDAAATAKHSHNNSTVLNSITSTKVSNWDAAATNNHTHANKSVIDGITSAMVTEWNSKGTVFVASAQPSELAAGDLFIQIVD